MGQASIGHCLWLKVFKAITRWLVLSRFLYSLGYHLIYPVLAIVLLYPPFGFTLLQVAVVLVFFNVADRGLAILCAPLVNWMGHLYSQALGFIVAALCIGFVPVIASRTHIAIVLVIAGIGFSLAGLAVRNTISLCADPETRLKGFSDISIGLHGGAAIGFVLAFLLPYKTHSWLSFEVAALVILLAGLAVLCGIRGVSAGRVKSDSLSLAPRHINKNWWRQPQLHKGFKYVVLGTFALFIYFPLFDLTPVYFEKTIGVYRYLGWCFALNAVMVICLQRGDLPPFYGPVITSGSRV